MKQLLLVLTVFVSACGQTGNTPFGNAEKKLPMLGPPQPDGTVKKIGSFSLVNQYGNAVSNKTLKGRIYTANTFNTTCTSNVQQVMLRGLAKIQEAFKNDKNFYILSFSMDPEKDSIAKLKAFCRANNISGDRRYLLTGVGMADTTMLNFIHYELLMIAQKEPGNPNCGFIHTDNVALIDRQGQRRGYYDLSQGKAVDKLIKDAHTLLEE